MRFISVLLGTTWLLTIRHQLGILLLHIISTSTILTSSSSSSSRKVLQFTIPMELTLIIMLLPCTGILVQLKRESLPLCTVHLHTTISHHHPLRVNSFSS
eukprot:Protomagalhaensia_sp_Gyna_25__4713@NODE_456_length_3386_cov_316_591276_g351_i0_p4_GENE_NODE_456_length_3386_cov_316_591276_g351_i0NODE_456_length_3386_cov_316_591276_g351_i0_p4_ORF_typecomplete_len100_score4_10DUF4733/PF15878_5/0_11_NODE_456_length_3386_cov_316_591276_g351_i010231322